MSYAADNFNLTNAPREMVQYVIDNVEDFESRYQMALSIIGRDRCPLRMADNSLYDDICDAMCEWCYDVDTIDVDDFDVEEIFG